MAFSGWGVRAAGVALIVLVVIGIVVWQLGIVSGNVSAAGTLTPTWIKRGAQTPPQDDKYFGRRKVVICGLVRDAEAQVKLLRKSFRRGRDADSVAATVAKEFADWRLVVAENDSKDGTRKELLAWAAHDDRVRVLGCGVNAKSCRLHLNATEHHGPVVARISKMVRLRNMVLDYIKQDEFNDCEFVVVTDLDLTGHVYRDGIRNTAFQFHDDHTIDAIAAWGYAITPLGGGAGAITIHNYMDPYAHKETVASLADNEAQHTMLFPLLHSMFRYGQPLRHVVSAFGGLTFYRRASLMGVKYENETNGEGQARCEHVTLHRQLDAVYMNPSMLHVVTHNPGNSFSGALDLFKR